MRTDSLNYEKLELESLYFQKPELESESGSFTKLHDSVALKQYFLKYNLKLYNI